MSWIVEKDSRKKQILDELAAQLGLPSQAIEKDWWVTQCLRILFDLPESKHLIFKGGTSLSKGWGLLERFSEDIDLSISRDFLGYGGEDLSNNQIKKLRKASCNFVTDRLAGTVQSGLEALGVPRDTYQISVPISMDSDVDPQSIFVAYDSLVDPIAYLPSVVKIEIGARALMEPAEPRPLRSLISATFPNSSLADSSFLANSVLPKRTFLEKICLLHETLQVDPEKIRGRLSRHLYDIVRLMDTPHAVAALEDEVLLRNLAAFRQRFNTIKQVDYTKHSFAEIEFVPTVSHRGVWEADYNEMCESMIYGEKPSFNRLIQQLETLKARFREAAVGRA